MCASQGVDIGDLRHRIPRTQNKEIFFKKKKKKKKEMFEMGGHRLFSVSAHTWCVSQGTTLIGTPKGTTENGRKAFDSDTFLLHPKKS
jgi:hypothetical protein